MMSEQQLSELFKDLGAPNPESWAQSQIKEGIPQLARFLFLKGCWDMVVPDNDSTWIERRVANTPPDSNQPFAGGAHALRRLIASGASKEDINELVRCFQAELLVGICQQIDDADNVDDNEDLARWALMLLDDDDNPTKIIGGLLESALSTDPSGSEMRPSN